jgi:hypothetical protein
MINLYFQDLYLLYVLVLLGVGGTEGDGDVYRPDNLLEFKRFILENTNQQGVHFMMADGVSIDEFA